MENLRNSLQAMGPLAILLTPGAAVLGFAVALTFIAVRRQAASDVRVPSVRRGLFQVSRWLLAATMLLYGVIKLTGTQLHRLSITTPIHDVPPAQLFWYFFGLSRPYVVLLGLAEVGCGLLLCARRTHRLGWLASGALLVNITALDFAFDVGPVKYWALGLTLVCLANVLWDRTPYRRALQVLLGPGDSPPRAEVEDAAAPSG